MSIPLQTVKEVCQLLRWHLLGMLPVLLARFVHCSNLSEAFSDSILLLLLQNQPLKAVIIIVWVY